MKDQETHILVSWKIVKNHTQTLNTKTTHKCWTQKTTYWWNLMENNTLIHQQIREHEKLDTTYPWMQRPTVAATMSQMERRWAATDEEQNGSFQRVRNNGFACTVCALFWWFCDWWVGATHWRRFKLLIEESWRHSATVVERKEESWREWKESLRAAHCFDQMVLQLMLVQWTKLRTIFIKVECIVVHITCKLAWTVRVRALKVNETMRLCEIVSALFNSLLFCWLWCLWTVLKHAFGLMKWCILLAFQLFSACVSSTCVSSACSVGPSIFKT